jgi:hypothetical protein
MVPVQTGPSSWKRDRDRQAYIRTIQPRLL